MWAIPIILTFVSVIIIVSTAVLLGKYHNPIEYWAAKLFEHETGIDIDSFLPEDKIEVQTLEVRIDK